MTQPPPSRYRVVEKGRRLIVIDTRTGEPARSGRAADTGMSDAPLGPERIAFDGRSVLVTRRVYDDKGPRRLVLDDDATRWIEGARSVAIGGAVLAVVVTILWPALVLPVLVAAASLASPRVRAAARRTITARLDRYDTGDRG